MTCVSPVHSQPGLSRNRVLDTTSARAAVVSEYGSSRALITIITTMTTTLITGGRDGMG